MRPAPFVPVKSIPFAQPSTPPKMDRIDAPANDDNLVSVRYFGTERFGNHDHRRQATVTTDPPQWTGNDWYQVRGSLEDAVNAARDLSDFKSEQTGLSSVTVLDAGTGVFQLGRNQFLDSPDDEMPAYISMPIDGVPAAKSDVSVPYPDSWGAPREAVRFNDSRVAAVVGQDHWAVAPRA